MSLPGTGGQINLEPELPAEIHTLSMNSWEQISRGFRKNEIDGAFINIPLAMDLFDAGLDLVLVMFAHRGGSQMVGNPRINKISDFSGKSVLVPHPLSVQHMLLHKFMGTKGLDLGQDHKTAAVQAEFVPPGVMPEMMAQDEDADIAAFMTADPFATVAVDREYGKKLLSSRDLWKDHPCCGFVIRQDLIEEGYEEVDALVRLFFESAFILDRHRTGESVLDKTALGLAADFLGQSERITARAIEASGVSYTPDLLIPEPDLLAIVQDYMSQTMGMLAGTTDFDTFINPVFARNAVSEIYP